MSTVTKILCESLSIIFNGDIIEIFSNLDDADKTAYFKECFTIAEIIQLFQNSYSYALITIGYSLASPENQKNFWQSLFQADLEDKFAQCIKKDYLILFAKQQALSEKNLAKLRQIAMTQCQQLTHLTLFKEDNISESELASFISKNKKHSITKLILELIQEQYSLDNQIVNFFKFKELFGNIILFFLHEQLRRNERFNNTITTLQHKNLTVDIRNIKNIVKTTENELNKELAIKNFAKVAQLGQQLERLQKTEAITNSYYKQFIDFNEKFSYLTQLAHVQLKQVLAAMVKLHGQSGNIKTIAKKISGIIERLMAYLDLSSQIKTTDYPTRLSFANLKLINQAIHLSKHLPYFDTQFNSLFIELGSIMTFKGDLTSAEKLFIRIHKQAENDEEQALTAFNLFQVYLRQRINNPAALHFLKIAIELNPQRYALYDIEKYSIERLLGADNIGCSFLCKHCLNEKQLVMVKCFWKTSEKLPNKIFREALLAAESASTYIPRPLDYGFIDAEKQERGYFVTEYQQGTIDSETWLKHHGNLDIETGIKVGIQIAEALQLVHDKGIFHLNLQPTKILLKWQDTAFQRSKRNISVKIVDFGLAGIFYSLGKRITIQQEHSLNKLEQSIKFNALNYLAPEQQGLTFLGFPDKKSDIFAFGKILYYLLTGESSYNLHQKHFTKYPELFNLLHSCVESNPKNRPTTKTIISQLFTMQKEIIETLNIWWKQLDVQWQKVFKQTVFIGIDEEPNNDDLIKIINLQELNCSQSDINTLEPLRLLLQLQELNCSYNKINDLEVLYSLKNLKKLDCSGNKIGNLESLREANQLQNLACSSNNIRKLRPLFLLKQLQTLVYGDNPLNQLEIGKFKQAVPDCITKNEWL
ncbi:protein kinase [Candidatus Halobeggiatoa sp. HSG11]|nr:protein kinase [Candidatus Halobeggiatoa sp. HSG11]